MTTDGAPSVPEITEFQPVRDQYGSPAGPAYLVGGYDAVVDAMENWRFDAEQGIVGVPVDRDISSLVIEGGYDRERALRVTAAAVVAVTVFRIDKRFEERKIQWDAL